MTEALLQAIDTSPSTRLECLASTTARAERETTTTMATIVRERRGPLGQTTANTFTFPADFYQQIRKLAEFRVQSVRGVTWALLKREIEAAVKNREVRGALFEGPIGEDEADRHTESRLGLPVADQRRKTTKYTFRFSARFFQQVRTLASARRKTQKDLVHDVLRREIAEQVRRGKLAAAG